eukprot:4219707-Alexandrium_andersonii.AAC.1
MEQNALLGSFWVHLRGDFWCRAAQAPKARSTYACSQGHRSDDQSNCRRRLLRQPRAWGGAQGLG